MVARRMLLWLVLALATGCGGCTFLVIKGAEAAYSAIKSHDQPPAATPRDDPSRQQPGDPGNGNTNAAPASGGEGGSGL